MLRSIRWPFHQLSSVSLSKMVENFHHRHAGLVLCLFNIFDKRRYTTMVYIFIRVDYVWEDSLPLFSPLITKLNTVLWFYLNSLMFCLKLINLAIAGKLNSRILLTLNTSQWTYKSSRFAHNGLCAICLSALYHGRYICILDTRKWSNSMDDTDTDTPLIKYS